MKILFRHAALTLALVPSFSLGRAAHAQPQGATIRWSTDYQAALAQSKRQKKPIFLDFSTEWCSGCKALARTTFRDPRFVAASRDWIMVKIDPEKSAANAKLEKKYQVTGYPTLAFTDSTGKVIDWVGGAYPTSTMLPKMNAARSKFYGSGKRVAATR